MIDNIPDNNGKGKKKRGSGSGGGQMPKRDYKKWVIGGLLAFVFIAYAVANLT